MNTLHLIFQKSYWDRLYYFFEEYCYNYFDESYEPEQPVIASSIEKIPLFIAFVVVFHFQVLIFKFDWKFDWKNAVDIPNEKIIAWESFKEMPELVEPHLNDTKTETRNENYYEIPPRSLFNFFAFIQLAVKKQEQLFLKHQVKKHFQIINTAKKPENSLNYFE
jgi:hypothetical protein